MPDRGRWFPGKLPPCGCFEGDSFSGVFWVFSCHFASFSNLFRESLITSGRHFGACDPGTRSDLPDSVFLSIAVAVCLSVCVDLDGGFHGSTMRVSRCLQRLQDLRLLRCSWQTARVLQPEPHGPRAARSNPQQHRVSSGPTPPDGPWVTGPRSKIPSVFYLLKTGIASFQRFIFNDQWFFTIQISQSSNKWFHSNVHKRKKKVELFQIKCLFCYF